MMLRLTDAQLREVMLAAYTLPVDCRRTFLEQLALALQGKDLGDGLVYRTAHEIARAFTWNVGRAVG